jgi:CheY-like chemotaxis protein
MVLITRLLEKFGYQTLQVTTGLQGFEMALQQRPDFIILDIQLPDVDGTEGLHKIRSSEIGRSIPVIAITSYAMAGDRERLLAAGCDEYIEKPIDPQLVISQIRTVIGDIS